MLSASIGKGAAKALLGRQRSLMIGGGRGDRRANHKIGLGVVEVKWDVAVVPFRRLLANDSSANSCSVWQKMQQYVPLRSGRSAHSAGRFGLVKSGVDRRVWRGCFGPRARCPDLVSRNDCRWISLEMETWTCHADHESGGFIKFAFAVIWALLQSRWLFFSFRLK